MDQISPHSIWIGSAGDFRDLRSLFDLGIRAVVQLALDEPAASLPHEFVSCRIPLLDGDGNDPQLLAFAVNTVASFITAKLPTLVACSGGMSRSPTIVAAALSLVSGDDPHDCLQAISRVHPTDVTPALWNDVLNVLAAERSAS